MYTPNNEFIILEVRLDRQTDRRHDIGCIHLLCAFYAKNT